MKQKIGAVSRALGISVKTIRYYEDVGLIPAPKRMGEGWFSTGQRVYEEKEMERLRFVKEARRLDFSIKEIQQLLEHFENGPPCGCGARPYLKTLIEQKLEEIQTRIEEMGVLQSEMQKLHLRTLALDGKTPKELMKSGAPKLSDAILNRHKKEPKQ
jgi:DNA-binding transcriptional MerR regulator